MDDSEIRGPLGIWKFPLLTMLFKSSSSNSELDFSTSDDDITELDGIENTFSSSEDSNVEGVDEGNQVGDISDSDDSDDEDNQNSLALTGIETSSPEEEPDEGVSPTPELRETLLSFQIDEKTTSSPFTPKDPQDVRRSFPIMGSGKLDTILVVCETDGFAVTLEIDGDKTIDNKTWANLDALSNDLTHVSAYERSSGEHVVSITNYPYNESLDFSIRPTSEVTFETIRAEIFIDEYKER